MFYNYFATQLWIRARAAAPIVGPMLRSALAPVRGAWRLVRLCPPLYLVLGVMFAYAILDARAPVTMIEPFQLSKGELPFSGEIVADSVQDGLKTILNEIEEDKNDSGLRSSDTGLPDLRNILIPKFWRVQTPPRFTVEVKGISYERVLSVLRAVLRTETVVSGDVIINGNQFTLIARAPDAGPWESEPRQITADGLKDAALDLARKIVAAEDPTLAGVVLLKAGQIDQGIAALNHAQNLHPTDSRLKLNLCMAFGANRRYDEAIECYKAVLKMKPRSAQDVSDRLAQIYFLKGERDLAIECYQTLRKQGYHQALLGLGEAFDEDGNHEAALSAYDEFLATQTSDRDRAIAHLRKSTALSHLGRHKQALEEYQEALRFAPRDLLVLVHEGRELGESGDVDAGIAELQAAIEENKNSDSLPFAFLQLGLLLEKNGDWQGAINQFGKALHLRSNYPEAHLQLARALTHSGDQNDAFNEFEKYAKLSPSDQERGSSKALAHQWLGNELMGLKKDGAAELQYREATRMKQNDSAGHCQLARMLMKQRHYSEAALEYEEALVPANLEGLNDSNCMADAQQEIFGKNGQMRAVTSARTANVQAPGTHAEAELQPDKHAQVQQVALRTGAE